MEVMVDTIAFAMPLSTKLQAALACKEERKKAKKDKQVTRQAPAAFAWKDLKRERRDERMVTRQKGGT